MRCVSRHRDVRHMNVFAATRCEHAVCRASSHVRQWNSLSSTFKKDHGMGSTGTITSFSTTPKTRFDIGGDSYEVQTAGQSYSLTNPDSQTLRFEVQPGDKAWYDSGSVDRAEIENDARIPAGTPINLGFQVMVEPNGPNGSFANTASSYFII